MAVGVPVDLTAAADESLGLSFDTYDGGPPEMNEEDVECEVIEEEEEPKEINSVIQRQLKSLKNSMDTYGLTADDIVNHLKKNNE
jgi:hypothetical protein